MLRSQLWILSLYRFLPISYFSNFWDQVMHEKQLKREGFALTLSLRGTVHHAGQGMAAGAYIAAEQEAERNAGTSLCVFRQAI